MRMLTWFVVLVMVTVVATAGHEAGEDVDNGRVKVGPLLAKVIKMLEAAEKEKKETTTIAVADLPSEEAEEAGAVAVAKDKDDKHPYKKHPYKKHPYKKHPYKKHPYKKHPYKKHPYKKHPYKKHPYKKHPYYYGKCKYVKDIEVRKFRVWAGDDDVEERDEWVQKASKDLELGRNHKEDQTHVGVRWRKVHIPRGACILVAVLRFEAEDGEHDKETRLRIGLDHAADSAPWEYAAPSERCTVGWEDWKIWRPWVTGRYYYSPSVHDQLQRLVRKRRWRSGNAVSAIVSKAHWGNRDGRRDAQSFEGNGKGPELIVAFGRRWW